MFGLSESYFILTYDSIFHVMVVPFLILLIDMILVNYRCVTLTCFHQINFELISICAWLINGSEKLLIIF
jgi:hypothetical protein